MKALCFIIAVYVALLSAIPCCQGDDCDNTRGVSTTSNQHQKDKDDDCKGCSPFFTCGTCSAFTFQTQLFSFKRPVALFVKPVVAYRFNYSRSFSTSIWQPPKMS